MSATSSAGIDPLVSRNAAREAFAKALRLYVGYRGGRRRYTMAQLSEGSGVLARVIESAMEDADSPEYRNPPLYAIMSLSAFLGNRFIGEWLPIEAAESVDATTDRAKESAILHAALALSVALADDELSDEEIRQNRLTLENAREAIDALLRRIGPKAARG